MPVLPDKQAMIHHFLDDTWIWKPMRIFKNDAKLNSIQRENRN
jgi:hypothetical protein